MSNYNLTLTGIVNGTNPLLDWEGLPPPSLFQEPKSESLTLSPSEGGKEDFLHETITSVPSSLSLSVNVCLSTRSKSSPHSCKGGLKMKFERAGEASIALSYMDGRSVLVTTIMRDPLLSPDQCFHDWEGVKSSVEKVTSSLRLIRESSAYSATTFVATTNERKNGGATVDTAVGVSLTSMQPTVFRVKKSEAGTFVMHQSVATSSSSSSSSSSPSKSTPPCPSLTFGVLAQASSPSNDQVEATFSDISKAMHT
ncbi:hypothetical protein TrRE_jg9557 [Triparma retinervis]|uniref:Uncharacterized protein n=1 Tax=Triparma retinervis TaxID=2557542 RepID=A0A9W7A9M0_9STRA|nr:hypothetical protein TrRE_jg9557 [Triparma retinervis]